MTVADGWALVEAGRYHEAVEVLERCATDLAARVGDDNAETAAAFNALGAACKFAGRFDQAEAAYARALPVAEAVAAEGDTGLLCALLHNLGGLAHSRRDYTAGEPLARRGFELRKRTDPTYLEGLAADAAALAAIIEGLERWDEAEAMYRQALAWWTEVGDAREMALTTNGLAAVVRFAGRPEEAEPLFRRALDSLTDLVGAEHPNTCTVRNNLGMLLNRMGRRDEALVELKQAAAALERNLGPDHPATVDVVGNVRKVGRGFVPDS